MSRLNLPISQRPLICRVRTQGQIVVPAKEYVPAMVPSSEPMPEDSAKGNKPKPKTGKIKQAKDHEVEVIEV